MEGVEHIQGRNVGEGEIHEIRNLIADHPEWSRRKISVALAQAWNWRTATGQLKDMAARSLLVKLGERGWIGLPPRVKKPSPRHSPSGVAREGAPIRENLADLLPLDLQIVAPGQESHATFASHLAGYHYLGYRGFVGENLGYRVRDRREREVACVLFGSAAWKAEPRDTWIGWDAATRARHLTLLTNNTRFLILPWVHVPHLASHLLGRITRRLAEDWRGKYGHPVYLVETYVDRDRFRGTCYRAANWTCVGQTKGRSRQDRDRSLTVPIKDIYVYALTERFREKLG